MRGMRRWAASVAVALGVFAHAAAPQAGEVLPLEQVRPGLEGVGRTVFEGAKVEEFRVHILGVLDNAVGAKQSVILARLEGEPLDRTGVIAGMSGSPVFVDGKLVGAIAYAFPFGKEPIAGITPIADMIEATRVEAPRPASARFRPTLGPGGLRAPLDREAIAAAFRRPLHAVGTGAFRGEGLPPGLSGAALTPLALPLVFSGFDPETFEWARSAFSSLGFAPTLGTGGGATARLGPLPDLEPGAAVGVSLIEGDLDLTVMGTITHIDGDRVYAFGHPFYNLGPTQFPMRKAYVYSVFPSLQLSWKIAAAGDSVGTVDQDRTTAIAGRLGRTPRMIPVEVRLRSSRGGDETFRFRLVDDELLSPLLAYVSLLSVLQGHERAFGTSTLHLEGHLALAGDRTVVLRDVLTADQPALQAATLVAAPLAFVMSNDFEKLAVEQVMVTVTAEETVRAAAIERAWVERSGPVRPGSTVSLRVLLRTRRGEAMTKEIPLTIPASAPEGTYGLLVADAATMNELEQREMQQPFVPRDLGQLLRALNGLRSGSAVYVRLSRPGEGAVVAGEYLPSLPGSVLSVLGSPAQGASVVRLRTAAVLETALATDHAIAGARQLSLAIER